VRTLRRRGSTFLCVGRYLALRPDLAAPDARADLAGLTEEAAPLAWRDARAALADALGRDPDRVFSTIDPLPVASTVLSQVHRARLPGRDVAVKLIRPDARRRVEEDLRRVSELQPLLDPAARDRDRGRTGDRWVADLRTWLDRRLDLRQELGNLQRLAGDPGDRGRRGGSRECVPRPRPDLCSERLLVTDWLGGVPLADLLQVDVRDEDGPWRDLDIDPARLARNLVDVSLRQMFERGFFCADVHPANVVALPGSLVSFAAYDDCAAVDPASPEAQLAGLVAAFDDDVERLLEPPLERGEAPDGAAAIAFRKELLRVMRDRAAESDGDRGELLVAMVRAAARNGIPLAEGSATVALTVAGVAALAARLDGGSDAGDTVRGALRRWQLGLTLRKLEPERLQPTLISLINLLHDSPIQVQKLLADLADGSFGLSVQVTEAPRVTGSRDRHVRLLTVAICSVGVALLLTASGLPRPFGVSLAWPLGAALAGTYVWLLRELRRLE
jgi:ubiquinone biosynthesis protein